MKWAEPIYPLLFSYRCQPVLPGSPSALPPSSLSCAHKYVPSVSNLSEVGLRYAVPGARAQVPHVAAAYQRCLIPAHCLQLHTSGVSSPLMLALSLVFLAPARKYGPAKPPKKRPQHPVMSAQNRLISEAIIWVWVVSGGGFADVCATPLQRLVSVAAEALSLLSSS